MSSATRSAASTEEVKERINKAFGELFRINAAGEYVPYVCLVCDKFLKPRCMKTLKVEQLRQCKSLLQPSLLNEVEPHSNLADSYTYFGDCGPDVDDTEREWIDDLLLSPRGCYLASEDGRRAEGFAVCRSCKYGLDRMQMPKYAIANNYCFGKPPACLIELTQVELAMITPVKTYGYCFTYTGGMKKQLQGSLSYYKVQFSSIARTVAQFDVVGLNNDVVVILHGKMTAEQRRRAREKNKVRTRNLLVCVEWLIHNNEEWKRRRISLDELRQQLRNPTLIDNSREIQDSEDAPGSNIEKSESFEVFFPDGSVSTLTGGQKDLDRFKDLVRAAKQSGFDLELRNELLKEAVHDFRDNNLVNACLLQFPYGRGGLHETRLKADGSRTSSTDVQEYVEHLSMVSQPHFHHELFSLILYNMFMKQEMVKSAGWRVRRNATADAMAEDLTEEDVDMAIDWKLNGTASGASSIARQFIGAVDTIARSVPHTDDAAKRAKLDGEAHQHRFGLPSFFVTFAPDDDNSLVVQILSGVTVDNAEDITLLTDEELAARAKQRTEVRLRYPGVCAFYFELALEIVIRDVIGWDLENQRPTDVPGLLGIPTALVAAIEEQGRSTLHSHIQVWLQQYNVWREELHSSYDLEVIGAKRKIEQMVDAVSSTALFSRKRCRYNRASYGAFPHPCTVEYEELRRPPTVVDDQELRNLRHKTGDPSKGKIFAYCPHCTTWWNNEEFVESYLKYGVQVQGLTSYPDNRVRRLKAMAVHYQRDSDTDVDPVVVDAAYNHHIHTRACFACKKAKSKTDEKNGTSSKKRKRSSESDECRFRQPQRMKERTVVQNASSDPVKWYYWDGSFSERHTQEICVERHPYDAFQNVCCPAISHSKLTCNSNIAGLMPGPVGQYTFKYNMKNTQEQDTERYRRVSAATKSALGRARTSDSNRSESIKRLLSASHAHQKKNVLHGTMASFLTRNKRRFLFSHNTVWCPLRDFETILDGGRVFTTIQQNGRTPFFQNVALHFLCRPAELEAVNSHDFYSKYEVVKTTSLNRESLLKFVNGNLQHPSYRQRQGDFLQGVKPREKQDYLVKIYQYDFPDTAKFGGSIMDRETPVTEVTETYCKLALMLFCPFRELDDLLVNNSYTLKFRDAVRSGVIDEEALNFLQNVQDARSNSFRGARPEDDLQRNTVRFEPADFAHDDVNDDDEEDENKGGLNGPELDDLLRLFDEDAGADSSTSDSRDGSDIPRTVKLDTLRQKGKLQCGYESLAGMNLNPETYSKVWESPVGPEPVVAPDVNNVEGGSGDENARQNPPAQREIGRLLLTRVGRRRRTFKEITKNENEVEVLDANGSVRSILDWAVKAELDEGQRRAFEIFVGTFILTFYNAEAASFSRGDRTNILAYAREKRKLRKLVEWERRKGSDQLICLLHGPGGCGKTAVIDLLLEYAREYCSFIEGFAFTARTIVVTAMSGVAATLLLGETTHRAVYLNRKEIKHEYVEHWEETRLLIVDEVSFASKHEFIRLHKNLRRLKQQLHLPYGGLDIIFSGDFRQLEPCGKEKKKAVYKEECQEFEDWVNCYLELKGMHRFKDDKAWGRLLLRFRNGEVTIEDIEMINKRVVVNGRTVEDGEPIPDDIKYATYFNRDRDAINAALFEERCKYLHSVTGNTQDSIMIYADNLMARNGSKIFTPFDNSKAFWDSCGEDDVKTIGRQGRMDPVLRLYRNCRVMLPINKNVSAGQANGTQAEVQKVVLKPGVVPTTVMLDGKVPVAAVKASQVEKIILHHSNERVQPDTFCVQPRDYSFDAKILKPKSLRSDKSPRETIRMKGKQLPLLINNATTGHKLQGSGVDNLFVHNWSDVTNWVYVMLSRVTTRTGLFCRKKLRGDLRKFAVPPGLKRMLEKFESLRPQYWSEADYERLFLSDDRYSRT